MKDMILSRSNKPDSDLKKFALLIAVAVMLSLNPASAEKASFKQNICWKWNLSDPSGPSLHSGLTSTARSDTLPKKMEIGWMTLDFGREMFAATKLEGKLQVSDVHFKATLSGMTADAYNTVLTGRWLRVDSYLVTPKSKVELQNVAWMLNANSGVYLILHEQPCLGSK